MTENGADRDLVDMAESFFAKRVDHDVVLAAEVDGTPGALWDEVAELGLPWIGIAEERGGSGGTLHDQIAVQRAAARRAAPLPLAEAFLAAELMTRHGIDVDGGQSTVAVAGDADHVDLDGTVVSGVLRRVPWAGGSDRVVTIVDAPRPVLVVIPRDDCEIEVGRDLAGQPRDTVRFDRVDAAVVPARSTSAELRRRIGLVRAAQISGAIGGVRALTVEYVRTRSQFGRVIGSFQSVQHLVVEIAEWDALTETAVSAAVTAEPDGAWMPASAAKYLADLGAAAAIRAAHQAHGAIGMTQEYALQDLTRRLNTWRGDHGAELELAEELGSLAAGRRSVFRTVVDPGGARRG